MKAKPGPASNMPAPLVKTAAARNPMASKVEPTAVKPMVNAAVAATVLKKMAMAFMFGVRRLVEVLTRD